MGKEKNKAATLVAEKENELTAEATGADSTTATAADVTAEEVTAANSAADSADSATALVTTSGDTDTSGDTTAADNDADGGEADNAPAPEMRKTAIEMSDKRFTLKNIYKNRDKWRFDLAIQRNYVWDDKKEKDRPQQSLLVHSAIYGFPIPQILIEKTEDGLNWGIDGQQRITTLLDFIDDKFPLSVNTPPAWGIDIAGLHFSQLPEEMQEHLLTDFPIRAVVTEKLTDYEREEIFQRMNGGSPLTKMELTRALAGQEIMSVLNQFADLPFFSEMIGISKQMRNRFVDQEVIMQTLILLTGRESGFSNSEVRDFMYLLRDVGVSESIQKQVFDTAAYLQEGFKDMDTKVRAKVLKKVNVAVLFVTAGKAIKDGVDAKQFAEWAKKFLVDDYKPGSIYGGTCSNGSAKAPQIKKRGEVLNAEYEKAFGKSKDNAKTA